jgi:hypothetical protein
MEIIANVYKKSGEEGDFGWMIKQEKYQDYLFIFNDNEEYHDSNCRGAGNAVIRKYNKFNKKLVRPRSAGIPTGTLEDGGYTELTPYVKSIVKNSIEEIKEIIQLYGYKKICYSSEKDGILGTGIFRVNRDVLVYITKKILKLKNMFDETKNTNTPDKSDKSETPDTVESQEKS